MAEALFELIESRVWTEWLISHDKELRSDELTRYLITLTSIQVESSLTNTRACCAIT